MRRPGGRTARVGRDVLAAALDLVREGVWPISVPVLANRAGVSDVTIYRRWGTVEDVIVQAVTEDVQERLPIEVTGDARADLVRWARSADASIRSGIGLALIRTAIGLRLTGREEAGVAALVRARAADLAAIFEADPHTPPVPAEKIFDHVLAPIYLRAIFDYGASGTDVEGLVEEVLTAR